MNASLWGLADGKEEWDAVIGMAKVEGKSSVWINGKVVGSCPGIFKALEMISLEKIYYVKVRLGSVRLGNTWKVSLKE